MRVIIMKNIFTLLVMLSLSLAAINCAQARSSNKTGTSTTSTTTASTTTTTQTTGGNAFDNFARFDTNHNNYLERREWPGDPNPIFSKLDKNHDGKVSRKEYVQEK
jgi:hypothetical protein